MPNLNVDVHAEQAATHAEHKRAKQVAAKLTSFTYVQSTHGVGYRQMGFLFDVTFSTEPVFSYGCQLVAITTAATLPAGNAIITRWVQDSSGRFNGVVLVVQVTTNPAAKFKYSSKPLANGPLVVAHNLTFTGPALPRSKAETTLAMSTLKSLTTGIV